MFVVSFGWCLELELLCPSFWGDRGALAAYRRLREAGEDCRIGMDDAEGQYSAGLSEIQQALVELVP